MVGVGAIAGTLSGGYTNAARSPDDATAAAPRPAVAAAIFGSGASEASDDANTTTVVAMTPIERSPATHEQMPTAAIALRFPGEWHGQTASAATGDNDPPQTMAYAAAPAQQAASGFQLASVDRAAEPDPVPTPMPKRIARPEKPKPPVLFNDAQLASIKTRLRLTRDQEQYWPQVEQALRAISWKMATQQNSRGRQLATIDPNSPEVAKLKSAAFPLIMSMREDQKQEVRQLAHTMGLKQVASMF